LSIQETELREVVAARPESSRVRRLSVSFLRGERPLFALFQSVGTQGIVFGVNVLTGVITARLLGPEGRGAFAAVTLWPPLLALLAVAGLNSAIVFRVRKSPEGVGGVSAASLLIAVVSSLLAIGIGWLLLPLFMSKYDPATLSFARICLVSVLVNATQNVMKQTFAGVRDFRRFNLTHLAPQLFYLIALIAVVPFLTLTARDTALALFGSGAIAVLWMIPGFLRTVKPRLHGAIACMRQLLSYSTRAAPMDIVFALATYADRLVLIPLLSARELGFYAVAFSFSRVIQLVQPAIMSVVLSYMSGQTESGGKQIHDQACRFLIVGLAIGCGLLWSFGEALLGLMYGSEFIAAKTVFRFLVIEASLGTLSQVTVQLFLARDRPGIVSTIQVITLAVSIAAMFALVPHYGAIGAALGMVGSAVVRWLLLLAGLKLILRLPLPRLYLNRGDFQYAWGRLR
jgi:O-antigen/teichoic acid export membrane protein